MRPFAPNRAGVPSPEADLDMPVESPAIARLIEEVRGTDFEVTRAYNRTYNRHNR